ncbi:MAG: hypothetical protein JNK87_28375 [Bryobacterales bacterium]|nr:hypothetical protein [Bryobacterales bacterium]
MLHSIQRRPSWGGLAAGLLLLAGLASGAHLVHRAVNAPPVQAQSGCSAGLLSGDYGYSGSGGAVQEGKAFENSHVGRLRFDGAGAIADGKEANTYLGLNDGQAAILAFTGTYSVDSACRGTATLNYEGGTSVNMTFVVVGGGSDFLYLSRDAANSVYQGSGTAINR